MGRRGHGRVDEVIHEGGEGGGGLGALHLSPPVVDSLAREHARRTHACGGGAPVPVLTGVSSWPAYRGHYSGLGRVGFFTSLASNWGFLFTQRFL